MFPSSFYRQLEAKQCCALPCLILSIAHSKALARRHATPPYPTPPHHKVSDQPNFSEHRTVLLPTQEHRRRLVRVTSPSFRVYCGAPGCVACSTCFSYCWSSLPLCNRLTGSHVCVATHPARPRPAAPETVQDTTRYSPFFRFRKSA